MSSAKEFLLGNEIKKGTKIKLIYNYQILIEYDGTNFIGWQAQKRGRSIQGKIEKSIKKVF